MVYPVPLILKSEVFQRAVTTKYIVTYPTAVGLVNLNLFFAITTFHK